VNAMLAAINSDAGRFILSLGHPDAMLEIQSSLERGEFVGMLADRHLDLKTCTQIDFLGKPAWFPEGPFRLAMVLKRPVFLMFGIYHGGADYEIFFEELPIPALVAGGDRRAQALAWQKSYVERLEFYSRQYPYCWFNFFDFWADSHDQ
jgi:predicted LPLAT superfamily acyltransferase